jgi:hypothetical protein
MSKSKSSSRGKFQSRSEEDHSNILKTKNIKIAKQTENIMEKFLDEDCNSESSYSDTKSENLQEVETLKV